MLVEKEVTNTMTSRPVAKITATEAMHTSACFAIIYLDLPQRMRAYLMGLLTSPLLEEGKGIFTYVRYGCVMLSRSIVSLLLSLVRKIWGVQKRLHLAFSPVPSGKPPAGGTAGGFFLVYQQQTFPDLHCSSLLLLV